MTSHSTKPSEPTLVGVIDKWRARKQYIDYAVHRYSLMSVDELWNHHFILNEWDARLLAAKNWEVLSG